MKKDHSEINREFFLYRVWRGCLRIFILTGLLLCIYAFVIAYLALRASFK
jgi:hypothetical protein